MEVSIDFENVCGGNEYLVTFLNENRDAKFWTVGINLRKRRIERSRMRVGVRILRGSFYSCSKCWLAILLFLKNFDPVMFAHINKNANHNKIFISRSRSTNSSPLDPLSRSRE